MVVMVACTYVVGCLPESKTKRRLNSSVSVFCFDFLSGALSLVCTYHNKENVPRRGICVANHTTPIDVLVLACDNTYDMVCFFLLMVSSPTTSSLIHIRLYLITCLSVLEFIIISIKDAYSTVEQIDHDDFSLKLTWHYHYWCNFIVKCSHSHFNWPT